MKTVFSLSQFFIFTVFAASVDDEPTQNDSLVLLHVLFRHGNRTPDKGGQFPTDPHLNETFEPFGHGQLTKKGKITEYRIGEYLRSAYGEFIPKQYSPGVVKALTTNVERTKMSLELVLASLYPPLSTDLFEENLNWQPIPFDIDRGDGVLGPAFIHCLNYLQEYYQYIQSGEGLEIIENYKDLYQQLSDYTGTKITTPFQLQDLYATLISEHDYGLELPEWVPEIFPQLEDATCVYYELSTGNNALKKYAAGFLLKKILEDSLSVSTTKLFLYSAHEYNVAAVLRTLNVFERYVPPYGATIFFEIHNVNGVYGLKLYYQDYTEANPKLLTIPGCGSFCELDRLYELLQDYLPGNDDKCSI